MLYGKGGDDEISGGGGHDKLYGGAGDDTYYYSAGVDIFEDFTGVDTVIIENYSLEDIKSITQDVSRIRLVFNEGIDELILSGASGGPQVFEKIIFEGGAPLTFDINAIKTSQMGGTTSAGSATGSFLYGSFFDDTLVGNAGEDTLMDLSGNNLLQGEGGNDTYVIGVTGETIIEDGLGANRVVVNGLSFSDSFWNVSDDQIDFFTADGFSPFLILKNPYNISTITFENDEVLSIPSLLSGFLDSIVPTEETDTTGGSLLGLNSGIFLNLLGGDDNYAGTEFVDAINGGSGRDSISGQGGDDRLLGGRDNDQLIGGEGFDFLNGGEGDLDEAAYYNSPSAIIVDLSLSQNQVVQDGFGFFDTLSGIELVSGSGFNDIMNGSERGEYFMGRGGNDTISGLGGNDFLYGDNGNDIIRGDNGDDYIDGGSGEDTLLGGEGDDTFEGGAGNDYIEGGAGEFDSLTYYGSAAGVNVDLALGKALNDGYGTVDTFFSIQSVQGSVFDDILLGSASDDTIVGEEGDDIIEGRGGNDILAGGAGDDTYVFSPGDGFDTIYDDEGVDTLVINGAVVPGNLVYTRVGNDLVIEIASGVTISGQFSGETSGVLEFASFAGGPVFEVPNPFMLSGLIALGEHYTINEETVLTGNVLANEIGTNVNSLTVIPGTIPTTGGGTVTLLANGDFSYMPALDFYGTDSFSYTVQGPGGVTSTTAAKIEVISTNDAPDAKDDSFIFKIGEPLTGNLLANDVDVDGDPLVAEETTITTALGASVYIGTDGNFIYSPPDGMLTGTDTFTYKILDSSGLSDTATVNLTIQLPNNAIKGTTRTDILIGTNANDVITGLKGDDILWGRNGNDLLSGDEGNDSAFGDDGDDVISGGIGNDNLLGNRGNDLLKGDEGNDILSGGEGNDTLLGGLGNDILEGGADQDIVDGGVGIDTLTYATALGAVTVDLAIVVEQNTRAAGLDTITGVENLVGSIFSDTLVGDANANKIEGWAGNDTIEGGFGNDTLYGDTGNDIVQGGAGNDVLNGGAGTDTVTYASATAAVTVNLATTTSQNTVGAGSDTITNFENLTGSGYNDTLTGNTGANRIDGGSGDDAIQGGTGNDTLIGGAGTDTVTYASATAAVTVNLATTAAQATGSAGSDTISGFENLTGSGYNDTLRGDTLANTVRGGNGNDKLYGNSGNDTLYGDAGTDTLYGDAGNDTLYGGASNDVLYGGANADIFKFASGGGIDTIKDFKTSELDKLDIKDLLSGYDPATKAITDFIQITTSGTSSIVKIDANGLTGGVAWTQIATLENITGLTDEAALKANGTIIA